ncbi:TPA_asm: transcriptional regulator [Salmonella enterica subsp. enterica serovar Typhimurium]|nr:transcriptional regulator [Salmonella enterica subsp. enterica serovar Typhimurium]
MVEPISCVIPEITIHNNRPVTTSIAVANFFGKQHKNVLQKIRSLDCSPVFMTANFSAVAITTQAGFDERETEAYEMTKDGFVFLVMGFTGKKAAAFKEAYIAEFNRMEEEIRQKKNDMIFGDSRTLVIHLDEHGNIKFTETVPENACVCTLENFKFFLEQQGWTLINRNKIKSMTVEQLLSLK